MGRGDGAGLNFRRCPVTETTALADGWILKRVQDDGVVFRMTAGLQDAGAGGVKFVYQNDRCSSAGWTLSRVALSTNANL
jgi:hypothetical protein